MRAFSELTLTDSNDKRGFLERVKLQYLKILPGDKKA